MKTAELAKLAPGTKVVVINRFKTRSGVMVARPEERIFKSLFERYATLVMEDGSYIPNTRAHRSEDRPAKDIVAYGSPEHEALTASYAAAMEAENRESERRNREIAEIDARNARLQAVYALVGLGIDFEGYSGSRTGVTLRKMSVETAERLAEIIAKHFANA